MYKQIQTYHPNSYIEKTYKEYMNGKLIIHKIYNKIGQLIYREKDGKWSKYTYDNNNRRLTELDSKGNNYEYKYWYDIDLNNSCVYRTRKGARLFRSSIFLGQPYIDNPKFKYPNDF